MKLHVVLEKQEEGGFVAYIPELPGCHTQGETRKEVLENIKEASDLYLETMKAKNKQVVPKAEVIQL
ncbi:type II toxin-antitoxin system HicB family antitoxin [Candidatus Micrarchaeota archaeon]|nr:type II toxin-antitoxin system HicB family antitoxin [Candidatus Micrarchaeota archaeon]